VKEVSFVTQGGKTGIVVSPREPDVLARAISTLLNAPSLREKYGKYARERAKEKFSKEAMVKKVLEVYRGVMEK